MARLVDREVYHYIVPDGPDQDVLRLAHAVDLGICVRCLMTESSSNDLKFRPKTTGTREDFRTRRLERDGRCVWTGVRGWDAYNPVWAIRISYSK